LLAGLGCWPAVGELTHQFATDGSIRGTLSHSFSDGVGVPDRFIDDVRRMTFTAYRETMVEGEAYTNERPLQERVEGLPVQVMIILGEDDELVEPESADAWRQADNALVRLLAGGHSFYWERPRLISSLIGGFASATRSQSSRPFPRDRSQDSPRTASDGSRPAQ
jgi:pimeloyl-ACP methyl ester carboxylesterase